MDNKGLLYVSPGDIQLVESHGVSGMLPNENRWYVVKLRDGWYDYDYYEFEDGGGGKGYGWIKYSDDDIEKWARI